MPTAELRSASGSSDLTRLQALVVTVAAACLSFYTHMFRIRENGDPEVRFLARRSKSNRPDFSLSSLARRRCRSAVARGLEGAR